MSKVEAFSDRATSFLRKCWPGLMGWTSIYVGIGYAFGPPWWYSTPSLELVRRFIVPVPVWGMLMIIAGALILTKVWAFLGHFIAMMLWMFWFFCIFAIAVVSILAQLFGYWGLPPISGWGAPAYVLVYASVHAYMALSVARPER